MFARTITHPVLLRTTEEGVVRHCVSAPACGCRASITLWVMQKRILNKNASPDLLKDADVGSCDCGKDIHHVIGPVLWRCIPMLHLAYPAGAVG